MTFTTEQIQELSKWEDAFRTAVKSDYARGMSPRDSERVFQILKEATGTNMLFTSSCSRCVKDLLKQVGVRYFADKQELVEIEAKTAETTKETSAAKRRSKKKNN